MAPKTVKSRPKTASRSPRSASRLAARQAGKAAVAKTVRPLPAAKATKAAIKGKPLNRREVTELRRMLDQERERLMAELETMEEHTPEVEEQVGMDIGGGYDEDLADVASVTFEREKSVALESSVQHMLTQVEEALQRIEEGTYGRCLRCGNFIDYARLKVLPYATLCIRCKELEEKASR